MKIVGLVGCYEWKVSRLVDRSKADLLAIQLFTQWKVVGLVGCCKDKVVRIVGCYEGDSTSTQGDFWVPSQIKRRRRIP